MLETNHKRKGLIGTILIHAILIVIFIFFGMTYQDPPPETGVAIVFGFDKQGSGDFKPVPKVANTPIEPKKVVEKQEKIEKSQPNVAKDVKEEMMTQDSEDSPISAVEKKKKEKKDRLAKEKRLREDKIEKERLEKERIENEKLEKEKLEQERIKAEQDAKKKKLDGMFSNLKTGEDATGTDANQGDDEGKSGYKGAEDGLKNAKSFSGNGGVGDYGNYTLKGRKPIEKPKPKYVGNDEGKVVIIISVDRAGKVIYAESGKGTQVTDPELIKMAIKAAYKTKWNRDDSAYEKQVGSIIYNFTIEN